MGNLLELAYRFNPNKRIAFVYSNKVDGMVQQFAFRVEDVRAWRYISDWKIQQLPPPSSNEVVEMIWEPHSLHDFSFIDDKDKEIEVQKNRILETVWTKGNISNIDKGTLGYLLENWYLQRDEVYERVLDYMKSGISRAYERVRLPLRMGYYWGETRVIQSYHDIDHDILDEQKYLLIWWLQQGHILGKQREALLEIMKKSWDSLEYFVRLYYHADLPERYMRDLGLGL